MKAFKFSLVLRTRENTDDFITLDDNIYGIHSKRVNILYIMIRIADVVWWSSSLRVNTKTWLYIILTPLNLTFIR